ncbi:MAG TPA: hypothetical protein VN436_11570, partial [Holophaga sp.]|nr:hypothetical protein [Holophaga sp.]
GGRSYYCFKFTTNSYGPNPSSPEIAWMVRPDDETSTAVIQKMGFSTSTPASARILDATTVKDVFFVGGGLSTLDVDTAFGTKLGRSVLAFRAAPATTGGAYQLVKSWDYSAETTDRGSVPAAVVPTQVTLQKGKAERVYFGTAFGNVFCLGAVASSGSRTDTANIQSWGRRAIFISKDSTQSLGSGPCVFYYSSGLYPVPLTLHSTAHSPVAFLGVSFGLGDRNDPMDIDTRNPTAYSSVANNRFVTILDRQDSASLTNTSGSAVDTAGFTEDDLADLTSVTSKTDSRITASDTTNYYLRTHSGYKLEFINRYLKNGSETSYYYEKNVTTPIVLNGMLEFTAFSPNVSASACGGSGGTSYAYTMCDVINPVYGNNTTTVNTTSSTACSNGLAYSYNDIPSEAGTVGLSAVVVVGEIQNTGEGSGGSGRVDPAQLATNALTSLARPRAWRVVR